MARADHIYVNRGIYTHHGIDCGDGTIIHYNHSVITRININNFSSGGDVFVKYYSTPQSADSIIRRAYSRLGENQYNLLFNNCEHFCIWCKLGKNTFTTIGSIKIDDAPGIAAINPVDACKNSVTSGVNASIYSLLTAAEITAKAIEDMTNDWFR